MVGLAEIMSKTCVGRDSYAFPESFSIFFLDTEPAYIPYSLGDLQTAGRQRKNLMEVHL